MSTHNEANLEQQGRDGELSEIAKSFIVRSTPYNYSYNFTWLGRPIIQFPQDIIAMQEIVWSMRPDLIIETGIAHGGSLIFHASLLELMGGDGRVLGLDIDIRQHNRVEIERHPMYKRIDMIQGSSVDPAIVAEVRRRASGRRSVLVVLDSNHTHDHVLAELRAYAPLVSPGGYCVVLDTVIEDFPPGSFPQRPWDRGNSPKTAVHEYLKQCESSEVRDSSGRRVRYEIDRAFDHKLLISAAPEGFLKRTA
jgi:cephalosporin hydroxylase